MINDDPSVIEPTLNALKIAFNKGKTRSIDFRKQQLQNFARGMREMTDEFCDAFAKDLGYRDKFYSNFWQMTLPIAHIDHLVKNIYSLNKIRKVDTTIFCALGKSYIKPEPFGVVLVLGAWNYPIVTSIPQAATAIAAGNAVILKPSELSPHVSNAIAKLFKNYLDQDLYRVIEGGVEVAKTITKQKVDMIIFTGGTEKGKLVAAAAAQNLIPCILELGGKSPAIVDGTGDLAMAARRIVQTKFVNAGQTCIAPDYILMNETIKGQFLNILKQTVQQFFSENPQNSQYFSRLINDFHTKRVADLLSDHGGEVVVGGKVELKDKYIEPTIIFKPKLDSDLMKYEIFGPILPVIPYKNVEETINFINSRDKPLALYYFGENNQTKERLLNETSSGGVCFNDCIFHAANANLPFGGVGASGYGSLNGQIGFDQVCHLKPVLEKSTNDGFPANQRYPPYDDSKKRIMNFVTKVGNFHLEDFYRGGLILVVILVLFIILKLQGGSDL